MQDAGHRRYADGREGDVYKRQEEGDAEMAVKGQIDDDIPGCVDVTDLSADVLDH